MASPGERTSLRRALLLGILRLLLLGGLAVLALMWAGPDEPVGNRRFLWGLAGLLFVLAVWGLAQTLRDVRRLTHRDSAKPPDVV